MNSKRNATLVSWYSLSLPCWLLSLSSLTVLQVHLPLLVFLLQFTCPSPPSVIVHQGVPRPGWTKPRLAVPTGASFRADRTNINSVRKEWAARGGERGKEEREEGQKGTCNMCVTQGAFRGCGPVHLWQGVQT